MEANEMPEIILTQDIYEAHLTHINGAHFTKREIDTLSCILGGRSSKKIASFLSIASKTVDNNIYSITQKLKCHSQERVRDIIEASPYYETLKTYYYWLRIQSLFEGILQKVSEQLPQGKESVLSYRSEYHPVFRRIVNTLALSGIRASVKHNVQLPTKIAIAVEGKNIIVEKKPYSYHFAILEIIRITCPELDLSPYLTEFLGQLDGRELAIKAVEPPKVVEPLKIIELPKKASFGTFKRHYIISALVASVFSVGAFIGMWSLGSSQPKTIAPVYQGTSMPIFDWNLPFLPDSYVDRFKSTEIVWEQFTADNQKTTKFVGFSGPGGVGKSFLALHCIRNPKQPYVFRAWFNADTLDALKASYLELGERLQLFLPKMSEVQKIREVKSWIESKGSALLVYDNVSNVDDLYEFFPSNGHIIITSRNYKIPNAIEIGVMTQDESLALLKNLIPMVLQQENNFPNDSAKLVHALNHFPLAISQAAGYMTENVVFVSKYLDLYAKERKNLLSSRVLSAGKSHEPIYVTWDMNLESISKKPEGEQALNLLGFMCFCRPESIPRTLLMQCLYGKTDEKTALEFNALIGTLRRYSLIKATPDSISLHRLVSDWLKDKFTPEERLKYLKKVMVGIQGIYPKKVDNIEDRFQEKISARDYDIIAPLALQIEAIVLQLEPSIDDKDKIPFYALYADSHYSIGEHNKSKEILEKLVSLKERTYGANHAEIVKTLINVSKVFNNLGEVNRAEEILKKILEINEKAYGVNHPGNIPILQLLSDTYYFIGDGKKNLDIIEKILPLAEKYYAKDDSKRAALLYREACAYRLLGDFQKSKDLLHKALAIDQKLYSENHLVGLDLHVLGATYYALGDIAQGKEMAEKALALLRVHLKPGHVSCALPQISLGLIAYELGHLEASKTYFQEVLKTRIDSCDPDHILIASALINLGLAHVSLGHGKESKQLLEKALHVLEKNYDKKPIWCSFLLNRVATAYYLLGDYETSEKLLIRALEQISHQYGKDHAFYAIIVANLGNVYRRQGHKEKSKPLLEEAYTLLKKHWGPEHPTTLKAHANLALWNSGLVSRRKQGAMIQYPF